MQVQDLGAVEVSRVVEFDSLPFDPLNMFGNASWEGLEANRDWLTEEFVDWGAKRIRLSFHSFVVKTRHHTIVIDTCNGNHKKRPSMPVWDMLELPFLDRLRAAGVTPESVDYVMCTHLHADHVGWNTRFLDGRWVPTFPNARYIVSRSEYEHWNKLHESHPREPVTRGAFADSVLPIAEAGVMDLVNDDHHIEHELDSSVWFESAPGHSFGNVNVHVKGTRNEAIFCGDVIHHPIQLAYPDWYCAVDHDTTAGTATRRHLLQRFADTDALLLTGHFREPTVGRVVTHGDAYRFKFKYD